MTTQDTSLPLRGSRFGRPGEPRAQEGIVAALAALADLRDGYGAAQSERVVRWAVATGDALDVEPDRLDVLADASRLHDIGKIAVPDRILHKPARLDEAEWAAVRRHAVHGAD